MKVQKIVDVESPSRRWEVIWALHGMDGRSGSELNLVSFPVFVGGLMG
jgi:hypothetical protein